MTDFKLPSYATLINQKLIGGASKGRFVAIDGGFLKSCLSVLSDDIYLDETWYLHKYPDVAEAVEKRIVASAREHYSQYGYFEHRMPYPISVDEKFYFAAYPDVRAARDAGSFESAQQHFEMDGFREGRLPHANFQLAVRADARKKLAAVG